MTHKEIFDALSAGEVLVWKTSDGTTKIRMDENGNIILVGQDPHTKEDRIITSFSLRPDGWTIDTQWYERIPPEGILCWVSNAAYMANENSHTAIIHRYQKGDHPFVSTTDEYWRYATPAKKSEVNFLEDLE